MTTGIVHFALLNIASTVELTVAVEIYRTRFQVERVCLSIASFPGPTLFLGRVGPGNEASLSNAYHMRFKQQDANVMSIHAKSQLYSREVIINTL